MASRDIDWSRFKKNFEKIEIEKFLSYQLEADNSNTMFEFRLEQSRAELNVYISNILTGKIAARLSLSGTLTIIAYILLITTEIL